MTNDMNETNPPNTELARMNSKKRKRVVSMLVRTVGQPIQHGYVASGIGKASFVHALIVIFLEFFAWGLLTDQVITVLNETFPNSTFLANGLIHGLKGILSFLSAPLIGAMSDIWGRKVFLLITVFFTCLPIPLMKINTMWYFAMISISGLFAVTFSVVFAYVADVTDESNRTTAYGLVSATFAASLITSPALGSYLSRFYSENFVVALATAIAVFDIFFILVAVPESLPEKLRERNKTITWENVDPFKSLKIVFADRTITLLCVTVFLSYLPEAGQYSCFFVYLKLIVGFTQPQVAYFIAYVGILSCLAQAVILIVLIKYFGSKQSIIIGLAFQVAQLALYSFAAQPWLIWFSGLLAAISSIGYPAISAYISNQSHVDQQGVSQGMVTGIRGLCNGIGPALYGFIFWIFRVNLSEISSPKDTGNNPSSQEGGTVEKITYASTHLLPGPPFLFGAVLALSAIFVTWLIPRSYKTPILISSTQRNSKEKTVVKIGNSSTTYNRTSSNSSLAAILGNNNNSSNNNSISLDAISTSAAMNVQMEQENLLLGDESQSNSVLTAKNPSSSISSMPTLTANGAHHDIESDGGHLNSNYFSPASNYSENFSIDYGPMKGSVNRGYSSSTDQLRLTAAASNSTLQSSSTLSSSNNIASALMSASSAQNHYEQSTSSTSVGSYSIPKASKTSTAASSSAFPFKYSNTSNKKP